MVLIEYEYVKDGIKKELKTPRIKLNGRTIGKDEVFEFQVLSEPKMFEGGKYPSYSCLVSLEPNSFDAKAHALQLTENGFRNLNETIGDRKRPIIEARKDFFENKKTGSLVPVVVFSVKGENISINKQTALREKEELKRTETEDKIINAILAGKIQKDTIVTGGKKALDNLRPEVRKQMGW